MRAILLGLSIFFALANAANALIINGNRGGYVLAFAREYDQLLRSGESFEIDGLCASACTLVLQAPRDRICVTSHAVFAFHAAFITVGGKNETDPYVSDYLFNKYPGPIQNWLETHGGLTTKPLYLQGAELEKMFRSCNGSLPAIY